MNKLILIFLLSFYSGNDLQRGIQFYNDRAQNSKNLQADPSHIEKAITIFESLLNQNKEVETAGFYYLQSLIFKGRFVMISENDKKNIFNKAVIKGNELVNLYPNNASLRFSLVTSIGLLAELDGVMKSAKGGVLKQMHSHAQALIKIDSMYNYCAGWKILGILNCKSPVIPMVLTWPDKKEGVNLLKKALRYFPADLSNNFYYAEALLATGDKRNAKIYFNVVLKLSSRKELYLEDEFIKSESRKHLEKLG
jgi:tetratricopeptide (TPR) repeat protein